ncbi:MAG: hypothetical protein ACYC6P_06070 [Ignavibacteriaceae bacterium]
MKKQFEIDDNYIDKIISVAYGDGSLFDKIEVHIKAYLNPQVKNILNDYKATAKEVRNVSKEYRSTESLKNVRSEIDIRDNAFISLVSSLYKVLIMKPVYSSAALIIILSVSTFLLLRQPKQEPTYSKEQVTLAETQVKESFVLVGKILAKAQNKITNEVISNDVARPIQKSTAVINNLFNGG